MDSSHLQPATSSVFGNCFNPVELRARDSGSCFPSSFSLLPLPLTRYPFSFLSFSLRTFAHSRRN